LVLKPASLVTLLLTLAMTSCSGRAAETPEGSASTVTPTRAEPRRTTSPSADSNLRVVDANLEAHGRRLVSDPAVVTAQGQRYVLHADADAGAHDLLLTRCSSSLCDSAETHLVMSDFRFVSDWPFLALTLDEDGLPIAALAPGAVAEVSDDNAVTVIRCQDVMCSTAVRNSVVVGFHPAAYTLSRVFVTLSDDSFPVFVVEAEKISLTTNPQLVLLVACSDRWCEGANIVTMLTVPSPLEGGQAAEIAVAFGDDGRVAVAFIDANGYVNLAACDLDSCADPSVVTVDSEGQYRYPSIALDYSGNAVLSYQEGNSQDLILSWCGTPTCAQRLSRVVVDTQGEVGLYSTVAMRDFATFVAYTANDSIKLAFCQTPECEEPPQLIPVSGTSGVNVMSLASTTQDVWPWLAYSARSEGLGILMLTSE